jgi:hypothetical protein
MMMTSHPHGQEWNSSELAHCKVTDEEADGHIHESWNSVEGLSLNRSKKRHGSLESLLLRCSMVCCCSVGTLQQMDSHVLQGSEILGNEEQFTIEPSGLYSLCYVPETVADQDLMLYRKMHVILNRNHVLVAYDEKFRSFHR